MTELGMMKRKLSESLSMAECVGQSLNVELNNEIDNSIDNLMKKFKSNPYNKETQYEIDDLVTLRDEVLNRLKVCDSGSRTIEDELR